MGLLTKNKIRQETEMNQSINRHDVSLSLAFQYY